MSHKKLQLHKALQLAEACLKEKNFKKAETIYLDSLGGDADEKISYMLSQIYLRDNDFQRAVIHLERLVNLQPSVMHYCEMLANVYGKLSNWEAAYQCYFGLIAINPGEAIAYYNCAYNLRMARKYEEAIKYYQQSLEKKIEQPEEVHLNMSVIFSDYLRDDAKAIEHLNKAIEINSKYTPALYNLANLYEEEGLLEKAEFYFNNVILIDPLNYQALSRLVYLKKISNSEDPLVQNITDTLATKVIDKSTKINLQYALGKSLNDCGEYEKAFSQYKKANLLELATSNLYDRERQEKFVLDNISFFSQKWFDNLEPISDASPIFICGMFRSGSTLTEQILASHPEVTAGGEQEYFPRFINAKLPSYPEDFLKSTASEMKLIATEYLHELMSAFPNALCVTDKRPDNFLYLGLIKTLFPNSRIIHTSRNPFDNCLSVYFLRLGAGMSYSTSLENIAHYYRQHIQLMNHWKSIFPDTIHEVSYDDLVDRPEKNIAKLLNFLNLNWRDECLDFHRVGNRVKTASVWQVNQPLYKSSSGRWKNYEKHITTLINQFKS